MQATQRIKGYDHFEQVALGGMAAVYKARKLSLDKTVAVKVLYPHLAQDSVFIERFKREARTAAKVQHDNIVNVIDYGEANEAHYIVMEYYDGCTVEDLLDEMRLLPLDICFAILLNVCNGLEAAHCEGLVHRDIKPANIIYTRLGGVKIADFGLAKNIDQAKLVTQADKVVGTPAYMSPEQTRGEDVGAQSDVFSLGVVAFELICGERPFDGKSYSEVVDKIQYQEAPPVTELNPLVDSSFAKIVAKMLEKDAAKRYKHISEVAMDLEEAVDKQHYKRDRRAMGEFISDPKKYLETFELEQLDKLAANATKTGCGKKASVLFSRRMLFLNPSDQKAAQELERLGWKQPARPERKDYHPGAASGAQPDSANPDTEYRVILESVDSSLETPATFALKLSMRIRSPLPRVMSVVKNMPAMVAGHIPRKKAQKLVSIIQELGGEARMVAHVEAVAPVRKNKPEPKSGPQPPPERAPRRPAPEERKFDQGKTEQFHPIDQENLAGWRATSRPQIMCPKCGWEGDADARFCPVCMFKFEEDVVDLTALVKQVIDNPLDAVKPDKKSVTGLLKSFRELPPKVKYCILGGLIILAMLIIFGR